jgi:hypothetical protein
MRICAPVRAPCANPKQTFWDIKNGEEELCIRGAVQNDTKNRAFQTRFVTEACFAVGSEKCPKPDIANTAKRLFGFP